MPDRDDPMNVDIRTGIPGDEHALALVGQATFLEAFAGALTGPDIVAHCASQHTDGIYASWLQQEGTRTWIAEVTPGAAPVGYLVVVPAKLSLADLRRDDLEVKRIYLLHRFQGSGLGRRMMDLAIDHARRQGAHRLLLGVYAGNRGAIAFYRHFGFRRVGQRQFRVGHTDYDDVILALELDQAG